MALTGGVVQYDGRRYEWGRPNDLRVYFAFIIGGVPTWHEELMHTNERTNSILLFVT